MKLSPSGRIEELARRFELSIAEIASACKYERPQAFYDVVNEKTKNISPKMASRILSAFPSVSESWLLTGEGEMLKPESRKEPPAQLELDFSTIVKANADMAAACKDSASAAVEAARAARMLAEESKSVLTQLTNSLSRLEKKIDEKIEGGTVSEPRSML